jgi:hypothetical protein
VTYEACEAAGRGRNTGGGTDQAPGAARRGRNTGGGTDQAPGAARRGTNTGGGGQWGFWGRGGDWEGGGAVWVRR